ncbi:MAG: cytosine permease, partial [Rhodoglobus sp.]|nr:cytosine permease [Rhodoglobus sp.]
MDSFVSPEAPFAAWPTPNFGEDVPAPAPVPEPEPAPVAEAPAPQLPAWDVPPPSADWAPGPEFGVDDPFAPEQESVADLGTAAEADPAPDADYAPEADPGLDPQLSPYAPPPLVEPPPLDGSPILPSEASGHAPIPTTPVPDYEEVIEAVVVEDDPNPTRGPSSEPSFSFDDLLAGDGTGAEELRPEPEPGVPIGAGGAAQTEVGEDLPVTAREGVSLDTDSIFVVDRSFEEELEDDVDETDRAFGDLAVGAPIVSPPSGPISTVRIPEDELVLLGNEPVRQRVFSLEGSGLEPTPVEYRVGRSARLFWLWFAANSSILSLGLGAAIFALGMSLRQSVVAVLAGVALSFIPLGLSTLAGKRSGQPTMVVSRATFGLVGNVVPASLALVTRVFWGAVLLWLLASASAIVLVGAELDGGMGERQLLLIALAGGFLLALLIAFVGYPLIARLQLIFSAISAILIVGLIAMTYQYIDVAAALTTPDGPWILTVTGAVLVFSFVGLVWATSGADLARYQRPSTSGAASMLWATIGATLPTFILIGYGALLAASDRGIASGFLLSPLDTLTLMLPNWYPAPLLIAAGLSLLSGIVITLYSGGFALQAIGVRVPRQWSIVIVGVLLAGLALVLTFG